ncbi:hypothetical protein RM780_23950 [Streptomyces sp. DSM 44917]|uniref:Glycerophosphoryl diester phosphodiesterase membrane domain-containing protein n=1 Tax=Streptomyces boetiae TaxID=3075541 RepID=A0ABU2LFN5_9ACTN|nr:hypothetical protein [Streptomyces sp. DSM 44917]MDT0309983.1 hypothetical protein [Streptomyces sp. DSM 44917]
MSDSPGWASPGSPPPDEGGRDRAPDEQPASPPPAPPSLDKRENAPGPAPEHQPAPQPQQPPAPEQQQGWQAVPPPAHPQQPHPQQQGWGGAPQGWGQQGWGHQPPPGAGYPQHPQQWQQYPQPQHPGWGGGPAGGGGWQPYPWVAKPGVIPLRPLGIGEILDGAVSTTRAHWRTALAIALGIAILTQLAATIATRLWLSDSSGLQAVQDNPNPTDEELRDAFADLAGFLSLAGIVSILGTVLATAMLTIVVSRAVLGRSVTFAEAWQDSRSRLMRLLAVALLVPLIFAAAVAVPLLIGAATGVVALVVLLTLGGLVAGVWLWVLFSLAAPALMLERQGVFAALRRSAKLVRGSWWRVFGVQLLVMVLLFIVSGIIEFPTSALAAVIAGDGAGSFLEGTNELTWTYLAISGIGAVVATTITLPISAGVTALLYIDQRIRREALDLELARAAGVATPQQGG